MDKLDVLKAIKAGGIIRQLGKNDDFETVLAIVDQLDAEGLVADVYRHTESQTAKRLVDLVKVTQLTDRGVAYLNSMGD